MAGAAERGGQAVTPTQKQLQWFWRHARQLPMMACDHMGTLQRVRQEGGGYREVPVCAHCGCTQVAGRDEG